jgi:cytochrome c551/c552
MNAWRFVQSEFRLFRSRGAQAIIPTVLTIVVSGLSLTLIAVIISRSPYTHSNLSPGGYDRTDIIRVGETHPFAGMPLINPSLAQTGNDVSDGRLLFMQYGCAACHGLDGRGQAVGPNLRNATPEKIIQQARKGKGTMPAFPPEILSDADLARIIAFLTSTAKP